MWNVWQTILTGSSPLHPPHMCMKHNTDVTLRDHIVACGLGAQEGRDVTERHTGPQNIWSPDITLTSHTHTLTHIGYTAGSHISEELWLINWHCVWASAVKYMPVYWSSTCCGSIKCPCLSLCGRQNVCDSAEAVGPSIWPHYYPQCYWALWPHCGQPAAPVSAHSATWERASIDAPRCLQKAWEINSQL